MRKRVLSGESPADSPGAETWTDLDAAAQVEVTSEDAEYPVEGALLPGSERGWRAATPGAQIVRLIFDQPRNVRRIHLVFREEADERTQEFALRWLPAGEREFREFLRQQYHFSPPGTCEEREDYAVDLKNVSALELRIVPSLDGKGLASLVEWRVA